MNKLCLVTIIFFVSLAAKGDYWTQMASFGGTARFGCFYFSIGTKGYIGSGSTSYQPYNFVNDFWEYDVNTNSWSQKANFPGPGRYGAIDFSIGTKGYVGTGWNQVTPLLNDFWQYDQATNSWSQKNNFPGVPRQGGIGLVINNKAYAGLGHTGNSYLGDFLLYNDTTDTWTQVASFTGTPRSSAIGFKLNNKIYIGCGVITYPAFNLTNDFWEYDPLLNSWSQKASFPASSRYSMGYFSINNYGYCGLGKDSSNSFSFPEFFKYDPVLNNWSQVLNCPVTSINGGFTIGNKGYLGCGLSSSLIISNQFWQYTPDSTTGTTEQASADSKFTVSPNPATDFIICSLGFIPKEKTTLHVFNAAGREVSSIPLNSADTKLQTSNFAKGVYTIHITSNTITATQKFVKQ